MWPWRMKMPTQNLLMLWLFPMRIVLATICCRFGCWGLVKKLNFCSDSEHKVWSRFWSWRSGKIWSWSLTSFYLLMLMMRIVLATVCCRFRSWGLVKKLNFCSDFEHKVWSRFWNWSSGKIWGWPVFFCWSFVEVMKLNLSQDSEARFGQNFEA